MMYERLTNRIKSVDTKIWQMIAEIRELKGEWKGKEKLGTQVLGRLKKSVLATSTGSSTRIEGARMSDEDVEKLMKGLKMIRFSERDRGEVRGYYEALKIVFQHYKELPFTENTIRYLHGELLKYTEKDQRHRGSYKRGENRVDMLDEHGQAIATIFNPTAAFLTPKEMQELAAWGEEMLRDTSQDPLPIIASIILEFLSVHPFQDGNGRMSRLLTNLLLLRAGYAFMPYTSHEKLIEDNKGEYYIALRRSQKERKSQGENALPWFEFFFSVLLKQSRFAIELLSEEKTENLLSELQVKVLEYIRFSKDASPREITAHTGIGRPTRNQILKRLLVLNFIEQYGRGRSTRYRVAKK